MKKSRAVVGYRDVSLFQLRDCDYKQLLQVLLIQLRFWIVHRGCWDIYRTQIGQSLGIEMDNGIVEPVPLPLLFLHWAADIGALL